MFPLAETLGRRAFLLTAGSIVAMPLAAAPLDLTGGDPMGSLQWPGLQREFFGDAPLQFDERVQVKGPGFAVDPMAVPITVDVEGLDEVERIVVIVDRNPIRKVLEFEPLAGGAKPSVSFRFKLEQASPVRAAARTKDGVWHVGGAVVDSAGGGCTVPGSTRADGSWSRTLGQVSGRVFAAPDAAGGARVRVRVMHPMDTGLAAGIPAFYLKQLVLTDATGAALMRLATYEPVSENPVFSFDFATKPIGPLRVSGNDNNGNLIEGQL